MICYNCKTEITEVNFSDEHIIPQAIGGRLKSKKLLCRVCNNSFGDSIDNALAQNMEIFIAFLAIDRERSSHIPVIKNLKSSEGIEYNLVDGFKPTLPKPDVRIGNNQAHVEARNEKEFNKIIEGIRKKYPNADFSDFEQRIVRSREYIKEPLTINFQLGGEATLKAVGKMAINLYLLRGGEPSYMEELLSVINNARKNESHIHIYPIPSSLTWDENEVSHLIYIKGCPEKKNLFAFVILFSTLGFVVNFSQNYQGEALEIRYCYNVLTRDTVEKNISMSYPGRKAYHEIVENGTVDGEANQALIVSAQTNLSRVFRIGDRIQVERGAWSIIEEAKSEFLARHPIETLPEEEWNKKYTETLIAALAPYIAHVSSRSVNRKKDTD